MHTITSPDELTKEQIDLVLAASRNRGRLSITVRSETHGRAVRGKDETFYDPQDREVARRYIATVTDLERLQLVRQHGRRDEYELTNFGWLVSRKL